MWRFSEDLDFTIMPNIKPDGIISGFEKVSDRGSARTRHGFGRHENITQISCRLIIILSYMKTSI